MRRLNIGWLVMVAGWLIGSNLSFAALSGSLNEKQIILRLKPEGEVTVESGGQVQVAKPGVMVEIGQQRYEEVCHICHESGIGGAPKMGDKAEWAPRIAAGLEVLIKHAIQGYKTMPAKGTCMQCSDEEIKKSVEYMVSHSK